MTTNAWKHSHTVVVRVPDWMRIAWIRMRIFLEVIPLLPACMIL